MFRIGERIETSFKWMFRNNHKNQFNYELSAFT
jgi:hypothetical protein